MAHRLFTNAPGDGGAGYRHLAAGALAEGGRVDAWLEALRPRQEGGVCWAGAGFRLGGVLHAAVARVDGAFGADEHGRGRGHLAHALVAPAGEGEGDGDVAGALAAAVRRLARPAGVQGDLAALVAACGGLGEVEAAAPAGRALRAESFGDGSAGEGGRTPARAWLAAAALAASAGEAEAMEIGIAAPGPSAESGDSTSRTGDGAGARRPAPDPAAAALVAAARLLPPRLRLALRWSVDARPLPDDRLRVVLGADRAVPGSPPALPAVAGAYLDWLRERFAAGAEAEVAALAGDWRIRSWRHLAERLGAAVGR